MTRRAAFVIGVFLLAAAGLASAGILTAPLAGISGKSTIHLAPVARPYSVRADYKSDVAPEYAAWADANGFTAHQFWTLWSFNEVPIEPYGAEVVTARRYTDDMRRQRLQEISRQPDWILLDCEWPKTEKTAEALKTIREVAPNTRVLTGPIPWNTPDPSLYDDYDGIITYFNVGYDDRMGEDIAHVLAQALYIGKHYAISPQAIIGGTNAPTDPEEFRHAMPIVMIDVDGLSNGAILWGTDRLFLMRDDPQVKAILAAWAASQRRSVTSASVIPVERQADYRNETALCRLVWQAGFVPKLADSGDMLKWSDIPKPENYELTLCVFNDNGHPMRRGYTPQQVRNALRKMEVSMGQALRPKLISKGFVPVDTIPAGGRR